MFLRNEKTSSNSKTLFSRSAYLSSSSKMTSSSGETDFWKLLHVFESNVRVDIIRLLLLVEWRSLSDITKRLEADFSLKITMPGVLKHMRELEKAGIVRHESGIYSERPDARKTIYILQGKERVQKVMELLEKDMASILGAGMVFNETSKLARWFQGIGRKISEDEKGSLKTLIARCESKEISTYLTEDEKKKIRLWKMMTTMEKS
jgi:DNA-binding transcriptional ArsR family regulator